MCGSAPRSPTCRERRERSRDCCPSASSLKGKGKRRNLEENSSFERPATRRKPSTDAMSVMVDVRIGRRRSRMVRSPNWNSSPSGPRGSVVSSRSSSSSGASAMRTAEKETSSRGTSEMEPSRAPIRTSTACPRSPRPRWTDRYTLCDVGCTAMSRMSRSAVAQPRNDATNASTFSISKGSGPASDPGSATSTANIFAAPLSARNKIPAGPNVMGPADSISTEPLCKPYVPI